eukprot:TRINITY_DN6779_c0_g1_i1.p1 TRINITY_DN6779_c0_g1~~TRINITY_DN6779_c0_g1_i1.p1  ORF type:complete len:209 (-),score=26.13 TRINITY_DN6779_c0_g1_i1:80-706(-)
MDAEKPAPPATSSAPTPAPPSSPPSSSSSSPPPPFPIPYITTTPFPSTSNPPRTLEWDFHYRYNKKSRSVQFKPANDKYVHFSVAWLRQKSLITKEDFESIDAALKGYLDSNDWKLSFTIVRACGHCTYGHMDAGFESLVLRYRSQYPLCAEKDLDLEDHHADLVDHGVEGPVFLHISHSRSNSEEFNEFMRCAPMGSVLKLNLTIRD